MSKPTDYTAKVFEVVPGGIVVHYQCGERDKYGVKIPVPEGFTPTREWLRDQIEDHAERAFRFWDKQEREKDTAIRKVDIERAVGRIIHTGIRGEKTRQRGPRDVVDI